MNTVQECQVNPGVGYRLLQDGERIEHGDEKSDPFNGGWVPRQSYHYGTPQGVGGVTFPTRRKVPVPVAPAPASPKPSKDFYPSSGYRKMVAGEVIKEGDQVFTPKPTVNPGEGYRLLTLGETVKEGDEWNDGGETSWGVCRCTVGDVLNGTESFSYRRALPKPAPAPVLVREPEIAAGPGYRRLAVGELIIEGDEIKHSGEDWRVTRLVGDEVNYAVLRRKVAQTPVAAPKKSELETQVDAVVERWEEDETYQSIDDLVRLAILNERKAIKAMFGNSGGCLDLVDPLSEKWGIAGAILTQGYQDSARQVRTLHARLNTTS